MENERKRNLIERSASALLLSTRIFCASASACAGGGGSSEGKRERYVEDGYICRAGRGRDG